MFEISELSLKGYRMFSDNTFQFKPGLNVIIGKICSGKTSIIESFHCLLAPLMSYLGTQERNSGLRQEDETVDEKEFIGSQCGRTDISLVLNCFDKARTLSRGRSTFDNDIRTKNNSQYRTLGGKLEKLCVDFNNAIRNAEPYPTMPVLGYYSKDRFNIPRWLKTNYIDNTASRRTNQELGYVDALKKKTDFRFCYDYIQVLSCSAFQEKELAEQGTASNDFYEIYIRHLWKIFKKAFRVFYPNVGIEDFRWFPAQENLALVYKGERYCLNAFFNYAVANTMMVVDIARRVTDLYNWYNDERVTDAEGIVLIDDIVDCRMLEKRKIAVFLALLTELFPKIQFIVTANQDLNDMYSALREMTQDEDKVNVIDLE